MAETGAGEASTEPSDWAMFIGRFHPLVVHLPIGFLFIGFLLECCSRLRGFKELGYAVPFVLFLGILSAIFSAIAGYLLSLGGGYDEELLFWHQWLGIGVVVLCLMAYILKIRYRRNNSPVTSKLYMAVFTIGIGILMAAGHYGGSLTHGSDYITAYTPEPFRAIAGLPPKERKTVAKKITNIKEAVVYTDIIHPIFDAQCISCHNPSKKKGDLLLHTPTAIMKGGESGEILLSGNADQSDLFKRLVLPLDHDDHMPPDGKKQPTKEQIELIKWWIDQGAPFDKKVSDLQLTASVDGALKKLAAGEKKEEGIFALKVPPANPQVVEELGRKGFIVTPIAQGRNFLQVRLSGGINSVDATLLEALSPLAEQLVWLDLSNAPVSDAALTGIGKLKNLVRLHMEQTAVTDAGLPSLQGLQNLEYLNLYGTAVTDKGIQELAKLKKLKSLYVWQTKVSKNGIATLQKSLPTLVVNTGSFSEDTTTTSATDSVMRFTGGK